MTNLSSFFTVGPKGSLKFIRSPSLTYKGDWVQVFPGVVIDRWHVGEFSSASYLITVEFASNKKEIMHVNVIARPGQASFNVFGRTSIDDELVLINADVTNSWFELTVSPTDPIFTGAKLTFFATYGETINPLEPPIAVSQGIGNTGGNTESGAGGAASNSFSIISVAGQNDVVATLPTNTLNLVAGNNISITTLASTDTIILASNLPTATTSILGGVKVDGTSITINGSGVISAVGGGGGSDAATLNGQPASYYLNYNNLSNKPNLSSYATQTYVTTAISTLVNSAPAALDTLKELATALGNDASFSTTVTNALSAKAPIATPAFTTGIKIGLQTSSWVSSGIAGYIETPVGALADIGNGAFGHFNNIGNNGSSYTNIAPGGGSIMYQQNGGFDFVVTPPGSADSVISVFNYVVKIDNNGTLTTQQSTEKLNTKTGATGVVTHDFTTGAIWYHTSIAANFTANFTNVPITDNRTIVCTLFLSQGANAFIPNAVQIAGTAQTIKWLGGSAPSGNANKLDIVSFTLVRTGAAWAAVTGSLSTYG